MTQEPSLDKLPRWAKRALQGIAFWMGHRNCLYGDYPLSEGALVAEVCNLIQANLKGKLRLSCEVQYSKLLPELNDSRSDQKKGILTQKARADLVVSKGKLDLKEGRTDPRFIIEVKRAKAPKAQINADLRRLAEIRMRYSSARAFLFVISEKSRPKRFVTEGGGSRAGLHKVPGIKKKKAHFRVRRTLKAAHMFKDKETAQYACLLEVYAGSG